MKTKIKNFISRHEIRLYWTELVYPSVGISFTQFDGSFRCSGYRYTLHVKLWKILLGFTFTTYR